MKQRAQIEMTREEAEAFLAAERTVICATNGPRGFRHLMPLWYSPHGLELWCWTYGASQKVANLRRDPRATLQVEAGDRYDQLRGVMIESEAVIHTDEETKRRIASELGERYGGGRSEVAQSQLAKRVVVQFPVTRLRSFDHRKLTA